MSVRYGLIVSYLGTRYHGWQLQENATSIQGEIEALLQKAFSNPTIRIHGSGRTDAGVHAAAQVAHLDLPQEVPPPGLLKLLNGRLPQDIRILRAEQTSMGFHARFHARAKTYRYRIRWTSAPPAPPWKLQRYALLPPISDLSAIQAGLSLLEGLHDFASFTVRNPTVSNTRRHLLFASAKDRKTGLRFEFCGKGFLRYQVRRMVGALLELGRGRRDISWLEELISNPQPGAPLFNVPPRGLCLERVHYDEIPFFDESEGV